MPSQIPKLTLIVLAVTAIFTGVGVVFPGALLWMERSPSAVSGEWWRLATAMLVNRGGFFEITVNMALLGIVGFFAEKTLGGRLWLVCYFAGGLTGEIAGLLWRPVGAGCSVSVCGLAGGLGAYFVSGTARGSLRGLGALSLAIGAILCAMKNLHGPPLLFGFTVVLGSRLFDLYRMEDNRLNRHG